MRPTLGGHGARKSAQHVESPGDLPTAQVAGRRTPPVVDGQARPRPGHRFRDRPEGVGVHSGLG